MNMRVTALLLALLAGCGPRYASPASRDWALLNRTPILFIRLIGVGKMPPPTAPVAYELCYDFAQNKVVEVHDAGSGRTVDTSVADTFRAWKWMILSSVRLTGGVRCWRERFEPVSGVDGRITVRATAGEPVGLMHVDDGSIMPARGRAEDEEYVSFVDRFDDHGVVYVMLAPRITVTIPGTPPALDPWSLRWVKRVAGEMPHLSDQARIRFRGNTMQAAFKVCVDGDGKVGRIVPELPLDGETVRIEQTLKGWLFTASGSPACSITNFVYTIGP